MTEKLYDIDSFLTEFTATVLSCTRKDGSFEVVLDKTAFFPEAGGQKSDRGTLSEAEVLDVTINGDTITHITNLPLKAGETVAGKIDFERRFDFMQQHSGEHIISGIANRLYGCENVGFHLSEDIVTLDFDKLLTESQLETLEKSANEAVFKNVAVKTYYPDDNVLEGLNYRSKKELEGAIRIVEIDKTDICACCAPHVKYSGQIGIIKFLASQKVRNGTRLEIVCGKRALFDYREKQENIHKISEKLCVKQNEVSIAVDRLTEEIKDLKFKLGGFRRGALIKKAQEFEGEQFCTAIFETELEIKDLQLYADLVYKKSGGIRGVFCENANGFNFAVCGDSRLEEFFKAFKERFPVRGGGRNGMVQGSLEASHNEIEEFFDNFNDKK